mmetsp:Transcript_139396/g.347579  ORF Transcript_139396/g.347579 Transcript_139396/m.347579 type:complete len:297 (-) Transcript_139396:116-1006(-)|eukprot:CAMPEP_0115189060 /NCGR_PEP_ID=MMETSP0270-20121206/11326_1 /TAXON_ID=71861 /ORGANISM="Scrippsiella trochoidea, Strain CCMP3099" /LENGTH=296 /DNA_ID=CAMNT_0002602251 /DNA_START=40 /DNA_END=930 /DNA_ORIENTATION=+
MSRSPPLFFLLLPVVLLQEGTALSLLQWNPHWQCFAQDKDGCEASAEEYLTTQLKALDVDFANIVELEDSSYAPPAGWAAIRQQCNLDVTVLIYNSARWKPAPISRSTVKGCMKPNDRAFVVQQFDGLGASAGAKLIAVGAHYPHSGDRERGPLKDALAATVSATDTKAVVFMADTNEEASVTSADVALEVGMPKGSLVASELLNSCCLDISYIRPFDRILANFGSSMQTQLLFDQGIPEWAHGQFHKPVAVKLNGAAHDVRQLLLGLSALPSNDNGAEAEHFWLGEAHTEDLFMV